MRIRRLLAFASLAFGTVSGCTSLLGDFPSAPEATDSSVPADGGSDATHPPDGSADTGNNADTTVATDTGTGLDVGTDTAGDSVVVDSGEVDSGSADASDAAGEADAPSCTSGVACTPSICVNGVIECSPGPQCTVVGNSAAGTACEGGVCNSGACVPCSAGQSCADGGNCQAMTIVCSSGEPVCTAGTNLPNGTSCGAAAYCDNGTCAPCTTGAPCTPTNPCHEGSTTCSGGVATCTDLGTSASNGTSCGTNEVCDNGVCTACTSGTSCNPGGNPCLTGTTSCATGTQTCGSSTDVPVGTVCGTNEACNAGTCVTVAPPQPIAPLSTALVTSQTPAMSWLLASGTTGAQVDICSTRACSSVLQSFAATGSTGAPPTALARGVYFWRIHGMVGSTVGTTTSPVWEMRVGKRSAAVNTSWGTIVDANGDGFADIAVGASSASSNAGAAYVYLSTGSGGLSPSPTALTPTGGNLGYGLASAGDVNGDGFADLIVSAYSLNTAYVYFGGPSGIATAPDVTIHGPTGAADFGYSVASAGDVNRDGYADIVIGAYGTNSNVGAAYVYLGGPAGTSTSPATTLTGSTGSYFGLTVAPAGDVNGDGYGDVAIGATGVSSNSGAVYVYLGGPGGLSTTPITLSAPLSGDSFGYSVWSADDVNGDGYGDLVVGANYSNGAAYVYLGGAGGTVTSPSTTLADPGGSNAFFGCQVSTAGDVNGDGFADVVVGAFEVNFGSGNDGAAYVYLGGSSGLGTTVVNTLDNPNPPSGGGGFFGFAVAAAGDINGDGLADIVIGAEANASAAGNVYAYYGTASGVSTSPNTTLTGPAGANAFFGKPVQ